MAGFSRRVDMHCTHIEPLSLLSANRILYRYRLLQDHALFASTQTAAPALRMAAAGQEHTYSARRLSLAGPMLRRTACLPACRGNGQG